MDDRAPQPSSQFALLGQRRFAPFFWTQFLGAGNDNLFKFAFTVMITYQLQVAWLPPAMAGLIRYEPALPALRMQLTQRFPSGSYAKVEAVYDRPFWRDSGLTGQAFGDQVVGATFDQTPPDGTPGVLIGFIGGQHARTWDTLDLAGRRQA